MNSEDRLQSLAQSSRKNDLKATRILLFVIGGLSVAVNLFLLLQANREVAALGLPEPQASATLFLVRLIYGGFAAIGALFIVSGIFIYRLPVPLTILCLVIYVGSALVMGFLDPDTLLKGIILKIIVVILLAKSVQTAVAYQSERSQSAGAF